MADAFRPIHRLPRDGTSQRARAPGALDPASAPLDERPVAAYLRQIDECLSRELNWFDETGQPSGTWDALLSSQVPGAQATGVTATVNRLTPAQLEHLLRLAQAADAVHHSDRAAMLQPHVALLLTVLRLLSHAQTKLNGLTARHLDLLYNRVLEFQPRPHRPDRVHAILRPNRAASKVRVPAGTLLDAGIDPSRRPVRYATERDVIVGKTQVADLRSIRAHVHRTAPASIRRSIQMRDAPEMDLLTLALGDPAPGDPLPPSRAWGTSRNPLELTREHVASVLPAWLGFARDRLRLDFFELRHLVQLKTRRENDKNDWGLIVRELNKVGRRRTGQAFSLANRLGERFDPRGFHANLTEALGTEPDFSGVAEVETIDDLFLLRDREEVRDFLQTKPYDALASRPRQGELPQMDEGVVEMMTRKQLMEAEWQALNAYLEAAGQRARGDLSFRLDQAPCVRGDRVRCEFGLCTATADIRRFTEHRIAEITARCRRLHGRDW